MPNKEDDIVIRTLLRIVGAPDAWQYSFLFHVYQSHKSTAVLLHQSAFIVFRQT